MPKKQEKKPTRPPQQQDQRPGSEEEMTPLPVADDSNYQAAGKLEGKVALISGGDSGIGRAVAIAFAKEKADVVISYLCEDDDAHKTRELVEEHGQKCILVAGDIGEEEHCRHLVEKTIAEFGKLDILVNNAAEQHPQKSITDISAQQLEKTFRTNCFSMFYLVKAAMPFLNKGAVIVNTTSVTAYRGSPDLLDYSSTKGAIVSFTRSLSQNLIKEGIRVNAVAPGPIWTPLIPSTFPEEKVKTFGSDTPMQRPGEPEEVANCFVFLASEDSSYITGQVLHPNGGEIING